MRAGNDWAFGSELKRHLFRMSAAMILPDPILGVYAEAVPGRGLCRSHRGRCSRPCSFNVFGGGVPSPGMTLTPARAKSASLPVNGLVPGRGHLPIGQGALRPSSRCNELDGWSSSMRMELDQLVNELAKRETAPRARDEARRVLEHRDAATWTEPGPTNTERQRSRGRFARPFDEALRQAALEMSRQAHVALFASKLAI